MAAAEAKKGPMPTGRRYEGLPVPFFFREKSAKAFHDMEMRADDVVLSSLPKSGTTWAHKILFSLLHEFDDEGKQVPFEDGLNATGQIYPEALPLDHDELGSLDVNDDMEKTRRMFFSEWCFSDLEAQQAPRLFSTHLFGAQFLPATLLDADTGRGRLVVVLRNLKDTLASLHYFRGEAKDGWLGNEHGPGSLARYIHEDCPNAYGSAFAWVKENDAVASSLSASGRVCVLFYEALKADLPSQLDRLASFLGLKELTSAKRDAVASACGFSKMQAGAGQRQALFRKGEVGDWHNYLDRENWARFDAAFDAALNGVDLAEPMRHFQHWATPALPPANEEQTFDTDPREWGEFVRVTLADGMIVPDRLIAAGKGSAAGFVRPPSEFNGVIQASGTEGAEFPAEAGRYHLFVSGVCPWASSVAAVRCLLGLESIITMDVADGQSGAGWVYLSGATCAPWAGRPGPFYAHEVYQAADSRCSTRITVPILWDTKLQKIVSNDSWNICKMLATAFASLSTPKGVPLDPETGLLMPPAIASTVEDVHTRVYKGLLNGVYRVGIGRLRGAEDAAAAAAVEVYAMLDELEETLATRRFLLGSFLTVADLRLAMTLLRYDSSYRCAFGLRQGGKGGILVDGDAYPNLRGFARDVYALIKPTVRWPTFRQYYRWGPCLARDEPLPDLRRIVASADADCSDRAARL